MSLRDQLLAKGLVSKKQVQHVERELKKQRRDEQGHRKRQSVSEAEAQRAEAERTQKLLNERRERRIAHEEAKAQVERALRIRNVIRGNLIAVRGDVPFFHPSADRRHLLRMWVSLAAAERLRRGELGIAAFDHGNRVDYVLIRGEACAVLREIGAAALVFHVTDTQGISAPEEAFLRRDWSTDLRARRAKPA